ncbi:MAG: helicase-related protein [Planctomycetota bacterium]|nr:helicase-related protein [Planctomycetota bacterium]MCX8040419.1 helicase-related protein [Planctomycetota bacterium]MDW8373896.1 helicase-related protein [Planctomycetota bacterium]
MSIASTDASAEWQGFALSARQRACLQAAGYRGPLAVLLQAPQLLPPLPPWSREGPLPRAALVRVRGRIVQVQLGYLPRAGRTVILVCERADQLRFRVRFFRAAYLARRFRVGSWHDFVGRSDARQANLLNHPRWTPCEQGLQTPFPDEAALRLQWDVPAGFSQRSWQALLDACLAQPPADPLGELSTSAWRTALHELHRGSDAERWESARRAVAWREALAMAALLSARRRQAFRPPWPWSDDLHRRILERLPFSLTEGQASALAEIRAGLTAPVADARVLAGDVGSGKTALALAASLAVIAGGGQVVWMVPTAVLAAQHGACVSRCLAGSGTQWAVLTGATPREERARIIAEALAGRLDLLIGTQAVLEPDVQFARLRFVVIDEQQRFGTAQRAALMAKAAPGIADLLLTTATPIPRTLALTVYGDLAITRIAGRPPGQRGATVELRSFAGWSEIGDEIAAASGPCFVVCPRIATRDDGELEPMLSVAEAVRALRRRFPGLVRELTSAVSESEKGEILAQLASGRLRCVVATTVIEVGIDIPVAELVIVLEAQRFGLSSLHQLRGRVGRGERPGRCLLYVRGEARRLAPVLDPAADGLAIAEADLRERGAGELLGLAQHGPWRLRALDLARDLDLLQEAHARVRGGWRAPPALLACYAAGWRTASLAGG